MKSIFKILGQEKHYLSYSIANMISRFGDSLDMLTLIWLSFFLTQNAALSALIFALNVIPNVFIQPIGGVLVQRFNYKKLLIFSDFLRGFLILCAAVLAGLNQLTFTHIMILTLVCSTIEAFNLPAATPFVCAIVSKQHYAECAGFSQGICRLSELIGTGLAGTIIVLFGAPMALMIDALTFLISGIITARIPYDCPGNKTIKIQVSPILKEMKEGFDYLRKHKVLLTLACALCIGNVCFVPFNSYFVAYAQDYLLADIQYISLVTALFSLTTILGALLSTKATNKYRPSAMLRMFLVACVFINVLFAFIPNLSPIVAQITLLAVLAPIGVLFGIFSVYVSTQFVLNTEESYLSRVMSLLNAGGVALMPIMALVCSFLAIYFRIDTNFLILTLPFALMIGLFLFKFRLKVLDAPPDKL